MNRQIDRLIEIQIDRYIYIQIDNRQIDRQIQIDSQIDRQMDRQIDRQIDRLIEIQIGRLQRYNADKCSVSVPRLWEDLSGRYIYNKKIDSLRDIYIDI